MSVEINLKNVTMAAERDGFQEHVKKDVVMIIENVRRMLNDKQIMVEEGGEPNGMSIFNRHEFKLYCLAVLRLVAKSFFHLGIIMTGFFIYNFPANGALKWRNLLWIIMFYSIALFGEVFSEYFDSQEFKRHLKKEYKGSL